MILSALLVGGLDSAKQTFDLMLSIGAGTGLLYLLRWFWWRINAWTEIAAMIASFAFAVLFNFAPGPWREWSSNVSLIVSVAATTATWLVVAFLSAPTEPATLERFYSKIRPAGPGWRKLRAATGLPASRDSLSQGLLGMSLGAIAVWSLLFAIGSWLLGGYTSAILLGLLSAASGGATALLLRRQFRST
jgi:hypothetical protein